MTGKPGPGEIDAAPASTAAQHAENIVRDLGDHAMLPGVQQHAALVAIVHLDAVQRSARRAQDAVISYALDLGASYAKVADVLGVSRQAVRQRFLAR